MNDDPLKRLWRTTNVVLTPQAETANRIEELERQLAEARNAALEEAERLADALAFYSGLEIASAIRALKTEPKK
jgi:hypothetical protein